MRGAFHKDFADAECDKETGQYMEDGGDNVVLCKDFWSVEKIQKAVSGEEENLMCSDPRTGLAEGVNTCPGTYQLAPKTLMNMWPLFGAMQLQMGPENETEIKNRTKNFMYVE